MTNLDTRKRENLCINSDVNSDNIRVMKSNRRVSLRNWVNLLCYSLMNYPNALLASPIVNL